LGNPYKNTKNTEIRTRTIKKGIRKRIKFTRIEKGDF
jgi:hypothetical protein